MGVTTDPEERLSDVNEPSDLALQSYETDNGDPPQGIRYATGTATGPPNRQIVTYNNYPKKEPDSYQDVCDEDSQEDLSQGHIQTYQEQEEAMGLVDNNNKDRFIEEGE